MHICWSTITIIKPIDCLITEPLIVTFFLIWACESVRKMDEVGSLELILLFGPCKAGKNVEWINAGLRYPRRGATSRVIRKYGSWKLCIKTHNSDRGSCNLLGQWHREWDRKCRFDHQRYSGRNYWMKEQLVLPEKQSSLKQSNVWQVGISSTAITLFIPVESLSVNPKIPLTWLKVTHFLTFSILR